MTDRAAAPAMAANPWHILMLFVISQAVIVGVITYCFTFLVAPWMEEFSLSRGEVLSAITLHLFAAGAWAVVLGRLFDRVAAKYLVSAGFGAFALGLAALSLAPSMLVIILIYIFILPVAFHLSGSLAAMALVARNFDERRGLALGLTTMGTSIGGVIFPFIFAFMLESHGWRDTLLIIGAAAAAVMIPLSLYVLRHERKHLVDHGEAAAQQQDTGLGALLKRRDFWVFALAFLLAFMGFTGLQNNISPYAADIGISPASAASFVSAFALTMVFGKLCTGALSDRIDNRLLFGAASLLVAVAAFLLTRFPTYEGALAAFILLGFGAGGYLPLNGSIIAQVFGPKAMAKVMGMAAPIVTLCAIGPMMTGHMRDRTGSYDLPFLTAAALALLTIPIMMMLTPASRLKRA